MQTHLSLILRFEFSFVFEHLLMLLISNLHLFIFHYRHHPSVTTPFKGCIRKFEVDGNDMKFRIPDQQIMQSVQMKSCAGKS